MKTFAIVNRKGGVGKTTTAVNLAYVLATSCRLRVLVVDADGQANATQTLSGFYQLQLRSTQGETVRSGESRKMS